jgi:hypothetical protein
VARVIPIALGILIVLGCTLILWEDSAAHQPNLVGPRTHVTVQDPEVSKAYYGELAGTPAVYEIRCDSSFILYVNLLVPDIAGVTTDFSADIYADGEILTRLDGSRFQWTTFYEPYGNDTYLKGPEYRSKVGAGVYRICVSNRTNRGKYVLATGEREEFPAKVILRTLVTMPRLKRDFFGKSPWLDPFSRLWRLLRHRS